MLEYFNIHGINSYQSVMQADMDGQLIHAVNTTSMPYGGKSKRPGYSAFLNNPDNAQVNTLFSFPDQNGTTLTLYRASGSTLYYSTQGTANWQIAGNGTITNGNHVGYCISNNVLICGDGAGSTRHTTNGTSFTNTTLAPVGQYFAAYQGRACTTNGTNSALSYSVANDVTNWNTGGTSDSSSFILTGEGAGAGLFVAYDKLIATKTKGRMLAWDGQSIVDLSTGRGPSSPYSLARFSDYWTYINQYGHYGFDGATSQLMSNAIQRQFYNRNNTGIAGTLFQTIPAEIYIHDYFASVGKVTDDFTGRTISNAIINYNHQKDEYLNWSFADNPTAWHAYTDTNSLRQLIFGNASGQCFKLDPTKTSDNGTPIPTEMVFVFTYAAQAQTFSPTSAASVSGVSYEKKWNWIRLFFNPGDEMNMQYAFSNTMTYQHLKWSEGINFTSPSDGAFEYRFPVDPNNLPRARFLFLRLYEESDNSQWSYLGCQIDAEIQLIK